MSAGIPTLNPLAPLSTRILALSGFPPELKTRDIQAVFSQWEDELGGFKIKWLDDTNALVIFNDAAVAKRAYLHTLMYLPPSLLTSSGAPAKVRPYSGDDAESIISSVSNRARSRSMAQQAAAHGGGNDDGRISPNKSPAAGAASPASGATTAAASATARTSAGARLGHRRNPSGSNPSSLPAKPVAAALFDAAQGGPSPARHLQNAAAAERAAATETVVEEDDDERRETPDAAVKASA